MSLKVFEANLADFDHILVGTDLVDVDRILVKVNLVEWWSELNGLNFIKFRLGSIRLNIS